MLAPVATFDAFARACQALGQTSSRIQIAQTAADFLASLEPVEAAIAARFMVGKALPQGEEKRLQVSGRAVWRIAASLTGNGESTEQLGEDIFAAATDFGEAIEIVLKLRPTEPAAALTLTEVYDALLKIAEIEGRNSRRAKLDALRALFERATALEGKYLAKILIGEMRHGMSEGLMLEAIARMADRPVAEVRREHMLEGDVGRLAQRLRAPAAAPAHGAPAEQPTRGAASPVPPGPGEGVETARIPAAPLPLSQFPSRPLKPMLAAPAVNVAEAFHILGDRFALEHKLDGARVQIHCAPSGVRIFSRRLNELTPSLPEVIEWIERLQSRSTIFDGELIATDVHGRALAFQELMRRFGRTRDIERMRIEQPVRLYLFDLLALDGELLIDHPYERRYAALEQITDQAGLERAARILPRSIQEAQSFYARVIADGYEGVVAKALDSPYVPGVRGRGWLKIKAARTFDLVIVAADWGYGRRHGWLSNYHLAARDENNGGFAEVGKTFKGMTDEDFRQMTERLQSLKISDNRGTVYVRPEVVVEVAYSDIQRSPRYAAGMALRFARIIGLRTDKGPDEADTIATVAAAFDRQLVKPLS
jgi:DNA ligase 1